MIKFEVGKRYSVRSACDHNCVWTFRIIKRTAQTVTIESRREGVKTCRINKQSSEFRGAESIYPFGRYSMAPILSADDVEILEGGKRQ